MRVRIFLLVAAVLGAGLFAGAGQRVAPVEAAGPATWTEAGDMLARRDQHTVTLLPNGRALAVGGQQYFGSTVLASAELYNPATNTWTATGSLSAPRMGHDAVLLRSGKVLVVGGYNNLTNGPYNPELYDPNTGLWSPAGALNHARREDVTATLLPDGRVLVIGGGGQTDMSSIDSAELYDPTTNTWSFAAPMLHGRRSGHTATLLPNGRVLLAGGFNPTEFEVLEVELYDPVADSWTEVEPLPDYWHEPFATLLPNSRVLLAGGITFDPSYRLRDESIIYDAIADTWTPSGTMTTPRRDAMMAQLGNGKVLVAGGGNDGSTTFDTSEVYDPATGLWTATGVMNGVHQKGAMTLLHDVRALLTGHKNDISSNDETAELYDATAWVAVAPMSSARSFHTLTVLHDGRVLAVGDGNAAEIWDADDDAWTATGDLINGRFGGHTATLLKNGMVLVVGTTGPNGTTAELYSPSTGTWSLTPPLTMSRQYHTATLLRNGNVLVVGSESAATGLNELYNTASNIWTTVAPTPNTRYFHRATLLNNGHVLITGGSGDSPPRTYDPAADAWTEQPPGSSAGYVYAGASILANGNVLVAGGLTPLAMQPPIPFSGASIFNFITGWSAAPVLPAAAGFNGAILLPTNDVLLNQIDGDALLYRAATNSWQYAGPVIEARSFAPSVLLPDGRVLIAGGEDSFGSGPSNTLATAEVYDLGIHTDTDGDGYNDGLELALGQHPWSACGTMRADLTGDGIANSGDQGKLASKFGVRPPPSRFDQNGDKQINSGDQGLMASKFNQSVLMCP